MLKVLGVLVKDDRYQIIATLILTNTKLYYQNSYNHIIDKEKNYP